VIVAAACSILDEAAALQPVAANIPVTMAELLWGVTHEGALDVEDLLDRRTRIGLVSEDRAAAEPAARHAFELAKAAMSHDA